MTRTTTYLKRFLGQKLTPDQAATLSILILNAPCHGFGDLIFAVKLARYLRDWYGATVTLATTLPDGMVTLGERRSELIALQGRSGTQCRRFRYMVPEKPLPVTDLVFVAPLQADYTPEFRDVKALCPQVQRSHTFFFSEYNDSLRKKIDFQTGVGRGRLGLLMTDVTPTPFSGRVPTPYAVAYIADSDSIPRAEHCLIGFIEMIARKYPRCHHVIVPGWVNETLARRILPFLPSSYTGLQLVTKTHTHTLGQPQKPLVLRADIFPVPHTEMMGLMRHSVRDILLTGDQSITDVLSCCPHKNVFYQIAPWKESFGHQLAQRLPQQYLQHKTTSCGTVQALSYRSNYRTFIRQWDFRRNARPYLDALMWLTYHQRLQPRPT